MPGFAMQDIFVQISRIPGREPGTIRSDAWLVEGQKEEKARLFLDDDFIIRGATHYTYRGDTPVKTDVNSMVGLSWMENPGKNLRQSLSPATADLFFEALTAMAQGRAMMNSKVKSGIIGIDLNETQTERIPPNCIYFNRDDANLDLIQKGYASFFRDNLFFSRHIHVGVLPGEEKDTFKVEGFFFDSVHEIIVNFHLGPDSTILDAEGSVLHRPDPRCNKAGQTTKHFCGLRLVDLDFRLIKQTMINAQGCVHLSDLTTRVVQFAKQTLEKAAI